MQGLRKVDGVGIARLSPHDATRQRTGEEMGMDGRGHGGGGEGGETQTYRLEFPKGGTAECPVEG